MGFDDFIKGQFIDLIEFVDENADKALVYKYTRRNDEIKQGAKLIVRNGQAAVFVFRGLIADCFGPGSYILATGNLPILSTLAAFPTKFESAIKSDLYFVNTTQYINNKWKTKNPIIMRDMELGIVRITSYGSYSFRVKNPIVFMNEVFGARSLNMTDEIVEYLTSFVEEAIAHCLGTSQQSILDMAVYYRELSNMLTPYVNEKAEELGIEITETTVENIGLPKKVEQLIDEQSGIGLASRNMPSFVQYQSARAIRDVAKQDGGVAGIGAGLAVGKVIAENISNSLKDTSSSPNEDVAEAEPESKKEFDSEEVIEQLLKYKKLLDKGILTQDEYDELKGRLLKEVLEDE
ncbi:MAG: SPFH domain-containing protein [Lachnospiraceae bacterium]|nr:SPFH domain-containing protein [Lachnospiraceae bacterium]